MKATGRTAPGNQEAITVHDPNAVSSHAETDRSTRASTRPRVWTVFVAVVLAMLVAIAWQIVVVLIVLAGEVSGGRNIQEVTQDLIAELATPMMFILLSVGGQLGFGLVAVAGGWLSSEPLRERLRLVPATGSSSVYPLAVCGSLVPLAVGIGLAEALASILPPDPSARLLYESMTLAAAAPFVLYIAVAPGICEELMFRGYVQRRLLQRWRPAWAIGVTSVVFALVHVAPHAILAALPLGVWFGVVAWRTGSIGPGIYCHAFVNGSVNAWRVVLKFVDVPDAMQYIVPAVGLLLGLVCFVVLLRQFANDEEDSQAQRMAM